MNTLVKGAVAGAAGIALLLGGAGTFALWNDSAAVSGGTVSTGTLSITDVGDATWADISTGGVGTAFDPATQKLVPGDTVQLTQKVTIATTGKNLIADLSYNAATFITDPALAPHVAVTFAATPVAATGSASVVASATPNTYTITPGTAAATDVNVTVTIEFKDTTTGVQGQNLTSGVNLSTLSLTLAQVRL